MLHAQGEPEIVDSTPINELFSDAFSRPLPSADGADQVQFPEMQTLRDASSSQSVI